MVGKLRAFAMLAVVLLLFAPVGAVAEKLHEPVVQGSWVRPSASYPAMPVWGHAEGVRVGLWPMPGPRGLLRVYTPYLGHSDDRMINYIAVEPIVVGTSRRSLSELESSSLDSEQGLRFWSADSPDDEIPRDPERPSRGIVSHEGGVEVLTVYVLVEPYRSGAQVTLRIQFRSDRPFEVAIAAFTQVGSVPLANCILTATMGNFARLRTLHLAGGTRSALEMWPEFSGEGFAKHRCFRLDDLVRNRNGDALFIATPDESDPANADYEPGTFVAWRYYGEIATQYWRHEEPSSELRACVNARAKYWASDSKIPGGVSFENFELVEPFRQGSNVWFGVISGIWEESAAAILSPDDS